jgi:MYXO-CTERM domain-containing protein
LLTDHPRITRMTSSISPVEMTVDPTFVFNPDMGDVAQQREAVERFECSDYADIFDSPRTLILGDNREIAMPSQRALSERGLTEFEWMQTQGLTVPYNAVIEQTGSSGQPEVVVDNRNALQDAAADSNEEVFAGKGCGCDTAPGPGAAWLLAPMLVLFRRRQSPQA